MLLIQEMEKKESYVIQGQMALSASNVCEQPSRDNFVLHDCIIRLQLQEIKVLMIN